MRKTIPHNRAAQRIPLSKALPEIPDEFTIGYVLCEALPEANRYRKTRHNPFHELVLPNPAE